MKGENQMNAVIFPKICKKFLFFVGFITIKD